MYGSILYRGYAFLAFYPCRPDNAEFQKTEGLGSSGVGGRSETAQGYMSDRPDRRERSVRREAGAQDEYR